MNRTTDREPPLARLVGRRPNRGATDAAKVVVTDLQQLLRAVGLFGFNIIGGAARAMQAGQAHVVGRPAFVRPSHQLVGRGLRNLLNHLRKTVVNELMRRTTTSEHI